MKKEQLLKLKKMLALISVGTVMTGCTANSENQENVQNRKINKETTKDNSINATYEGYYLEIKEYSNSDFDLYITKPFNVGGINYLPEEYEFMDFSNDSIGYKVVIKSENVESVDVKKFEPVTSMNENNEIISYYHVPDGYNLTDDLNYMFRCKENKKTNVLK